MMIARRILLYGWLPVWWFADYRSWVSLAGCWCTLLLNIGKFLCRWGWHRAQERLPDIRFDPASGMMRVDHRITCVRCQQVLVAWADYIPQKIGVVRDG
jgi:hypothetical protein